MQSDGISTYTLLEGFEFTGGQRIGLANDGNHIDAGREAAHQLDVNLAEPI